MRRKKKSDTSVCTYHSDLKGLSSRPLPYRHSEAFTAAGKNPIADERKTLEGRTVDWLLDDMRDSAIEAESQVEINYGKEQFSEHMQAIIAIKTEVDGELIVVEKQRQMLIDEIAYYQKLIDELEEGDDNRHE